MPTRVIDVGDAGSEFVRLWKPGPGARLPYVALSHPWGEGRHFVTNVSNLAQHSEGIRLRDLPNTFRDAVLATRAINIRHLWIDSICIIQGPGGDFDVEAKSMECVFSSAYVVLAASRSRNQHDGFLGYRRRRDYVTLFDGETPFYVCEFIDNFKRDVLDSHLNQRGWVLQEHALARRTVFFAGLQTYFECGDGVRCETLTKMRNSLAAFLGDPKFPRTFMSASQGEKIIRLQNLWKVYSSLSFTHDYDRAIAIEGVFHRLLTAFKARGKFGVFDEGHSEKADQPGGLLRRMLLWYRPSNKKPMTRIQFPSGKGAPSWSWMAYVGEIEFLRPKFGNIDWMEVRPPWSRNGNDAMAGEDVALRGRMSEIVGVGPGFKGESEGQLFYDGMRSNHGPQDKMECVVLGIEKGAAQLKSRIHYFIIVRPAGRHAVRPDGAKVYERVGAGYLPGQYISSSGLDAAIC